MPKAPAGNLPEKRNTDAFDQDDPPSAAALERLRAKLARHDKDAAQLAEAMRRKPKPS